MPFAPTAKARQNTHQQLPTNVVAMAWLMLSPWLGDYWHGMEVVGIAWLGGCRHGSEVVAMAWLMLLPWRGV